MAATLASLCSIVGRSRAPENIVRPRSRPFHESETRASGCSIVNTSHVMLADRRCQVSQCSIRQMEAGCLSTSSVDVCSTLAKLSRCGTENIQASRSCICMMPLRTSKWGIPVESQGSIYCQNVHKSWQIKRPDISLIEYFKSLYIIYLCQSDCRKTMRI